MHLDSLRRKLSTRLGGAFWWSVTLIAGASAARLTLGVDDWPRFVFALFVIGAIGFIAGYFVIWPLREAQRRTAIPFGELFVCVFGFIFVAAMCMAVVKQAGVESTRYHMDAAGRGVEFSRGEVPLGFWLMPVAVGLFGGFVLFASIGAARSVWRKLKSRKAATSAQSTSTTPPPASPSR